MKLLELPQNTPEWEEFRRSHIGASDIPIILGKSPYKKANKLWDEKVLGKKGYTNQAMKDGHDLEHLARKWANHTHSCSYEPATYLHKNEWLMASLDGFDSVHGNIIEIKHPNEKLVLEIEEGNIPEHYIYQMQAQMYVMNKKRAFLVVPRPGYKARLERGDEPLYSMHTVNRNEAMIKELLEAGKAFYTSMLEFNAPVGQNCDFVERTDSEWEEAALARLKAKETFDMAKEYLDICDDSLKYLAGDVSVKGCGISVSKSVVKGTVDYSKIPELKGVNLDQFRKPPLERWRIVSV